MIPLRTKNLTGRRSPARLLILACLLALLGACATRPVPEAVTAPESAWLAHRASVAALKDWRIRGRVAVRRDDHGWSADFDWQQTGESYRIRMRGPFGRGAVELRGDRSGVWLQRQDGPPVYARSAERLLRDETGWELPVHGLGDWLRGLPAAAEPAALDWDGLGRLRKLQQDGWSIDYRRYREVGQRQLPDKMQLLRDSLLVKLVIDEWQLP
ncbi:MAG: lipoprotein insertase outer membrane protein LolB [Gammaproteobacteria bacterium]